MQVDNIFDIPEDVVFDNVEDAIKALKLDRRHRWHVWIDYLIYEFRFTAPCSGCTCDCSDGYGCNHKNSGCVECGYTGKRRDSIPIYAQTSDGGYVIIKNIK